jgi:hypothetical protein
MPSDCPNRSGTNKPQVAGDTAYFPHLTPTWISPILSLPDFWGRTGFDHVNTPEAACRGRCVGLVNHRIKTKKLTKN